MDQNELADRACLNVNTIRSMEGSGSNAIAGRAANVQAVQRALEAVGVEFLNHGRPGVRLRSTAATDHPKPVGPATNLIGEMDEAIDKDRSKKG